jgi:hypothetical protein
MDAVGADDFHVFCNILHGEILCWWDHLNAPTECGFIPPFGDAPIVPRDTGSRLAPLRSAASSPKHDD